jgi:hypothetical protein
VGHQLSQMMTVIIIGAMSDCWAEGGLLVDEMGFERFTRFDGRSLLLLALEVWDDRLYDLTSNSIYCR